MYCVVAVAPGTDSSGEYVHSIQPDFVDTTAHFIVTVDILDSAKAVIVHSHFPTQT